METEKKIRKVRSSNLELYRIITMLLIIAHHFVVNSGVMESVLAHPDKANSYFLLVFGAWGKTGINCFVFITGYFMCKSNISLRKFLKLVIQVWFYYILFYVLFIIAGQNEFSVYKTIRVLFPVKNMTDDFISAFIVFYLFIPFLNKWMGALNKREHLWLAILCFAVFSLAASDPMIFSIRINYVLHFIVLFIIASYIRFYGFPIRISHNGWGWLTLVSVILGVASVVTLNYLHIIRGGNPRGMDQFYMLADSNKVLAVAVALCSFMWFKDLKIRHVPLINALGGVTFGILLLHANSNAMRKWLWQDTVDVPGHFDDPWLWAYAPGVVLLIFGVCAAIDWCRQHWLEDRMVDGVYRFVTSNPVVKRFINEDGPTDK